MFLQFVSLVCDSHGQFSPCVVNGRRFWQFVLGCIFRTWILRFCNLSLSASFALVENFETPQNLVKKNRAKHQQKSFCFVWLLPKVESSLFLKTQIHQRFYNSAESHTQKCRIHARFHDSAESCTKCEVQKLLRFCFAESRADSKTLFRF